MYKFITITLSVILSIFATAQQYQFKNSSPTPRGATATSAVEIDGELKTSKIYVCGGTVQGLPSSLVEEYNVLTDSWSTKSPLPYAILEGFAATVNGKIYVIGGYTTSGALDKVQEYDPITDTWSIKSPMPTPRSQLSGAVINGKIYVVGGWPGQYSILEIYDPTTDTWTTGSSLSYGLMQNNGGTAFNNELYIIGGKDYAWSSVFNDNSKYSPLNNSWTTMSVLPAQRFSGAAVNYNGRIHYFGGCVSSWSDNFNTHFIFDPILNSWISGVSMPKKLSTHVAVVANNRVYIMGGIDSSGKFVNSTIEYSEPLLAVNNITHSAARVVTIYRKENSIVARINTEPIKAHVSIYDASGRSILTEVLHKDYFEFPTSTLARGLYLVKVNVNGITQISKILL